MNVRDIKRDIRVRTTELRSTKGLYLSEELLAQRSEGKMGTVKGKLSYYGDYMWWIEHDTGEIAPYCFTEFQPILSETG